MCRKTIEGVRAEHGVTERALSLSLRKKEAGLFDEHLFWWSDALRTVGNDAAHEEKVSIAQPDATDTIEFANANLDYLSYRDRVEQL